MLNLKPAIRVGPLTFVGGSRSVALRLELTAFLVGNPGPEGPEGPEGPQGNTGAGGSADFEVVLPVAVGGTRAVTWGGAALNQGNLDTYAGVTLTAGAAGTSVEVRRFGILEDPSLALIANAPVFASANGVLTAAATSTPLRRIGFALSATKITLDPFPTIGD